MPEQLRLIMRVTAHRGLLLSWLLRHAGGGTLHLGRAGGRPVEDSRCRPVVHRGVPSRHRTHLHLQGRLGMHLRGTNQVAGAASHRGYWPFLLDSHEAAFVGPDSLHLLLLEAGLAHVYRLLEFRLEQA